MNIKKIKPLLLEIFMHGVSFEQERKATGDLKLIPGDVIDDYIEDNGDLIKKTIKIMGGCDCEETEHVIENDDLPYGENIEYDKCKCCGKVINLKHV